MLRRKTRDEMKLKNDRYNNEVKQMNKTFNRMTNEMSKMSREPTEKKIKFNVINYIYYIFDLVKAWMWLKNVTTQNKWNRLKKRSSRHYYLTILKTDFRRTQAVNFWKPFCKFPKLEDCQKHSELSKLKESHLISAF